MIVVSNRIPRLIRRLVAIGAVLAAAVGLAGVQAVPAGAGSSATPAASSPSSACGLHSANGAVKHVIYIQFDNTHLTRDNPNVPSDLEQMPHLLSFIEGNGVMLADHHSELIAHTASGILTSLTCTRIATASQSATATSTTGLTDPPPPGCRSPIGRMGSSTPPTPPRPTRTTT